MARLLALLAVAVAVAGCSAAGGASPASESQARANPSESLSPVASPSLRSYAPMASPETGMARLEPDGGAYFGLNIDWGSQTAAAASAALGVSPAVWVQFARFPLDDGARANLDSFIEQVAGQGGMALITLEPHDGLAAVTDQAAADVADLLARYWTSFGVPTFVRFAHEMNGSWYPWGQAPDDYVSAFRRVATAVHARSPASAMVWAPNEGRGYPFRGQPFGAEPGSPEAAALDTDGDGALSETDDPYAPYYPGDDFVDWVGMSLYHWGLEYPWGENEMPPDGAFAALLRGRGSGDGAARSSIPDFYATYAEGRDKPLAIVETAILYDPAAKAGPNEAELKSAWFRNVFSEATRDAFPRIGMLSWFEWRKEEPEVGRVIDWRLGSDPALARRLLTSVPNGWLRFAGDSPDRLGRTGRAARRRSGPMI